MNKRTSLQVLYESRKIGTLALAPDFVVAFEYDKEWLRDGFSISPFSLPLREGVFLPKKYDPFEGVFGVFSDSLPDGWGRLLLDRFLQKQGIRATELSSLERLAIVGKTGMGALSYVPEEKINFSLSKLDFDEMQRECEKIFNSEHSEELDFLFKMGGSSGGARPKVFYRLDGEEWIVKFPTSFEGKDSGKMEYDYALCAKNCGIEMEEVRLLPSALCEGYFATKRFDRKDGKRFHMISVSGLLETSHRYPNLDYEHLMKLVLKLTGSFAEVEKLYRRMCFNVFSHNRDDHSKNFAFLYKNGGYVLSPAYDLTFSNSIGGEHATTVNDEGKNVKMEDILTLADKMKLDRKKSREIAEFVRERVQEDLKKYLN